MAETARCSHSPRYILAAVSIKQGLWTTGYGLGIKHGLGIKRGMLALYKNIAHSPEVPAHIGLTISIAGKEKEDTESHKIGELYEFSNESSLD